MGPLSFAPRLVAVLGPTNTGKTHYAIERMLGHQTGMIGFPLRLLAREFKEYKKAKYEFMELPAPHEPRIYKIGERQCQCRLCVERLIALFPDLV